MSYTGGNNWNTLFYFGTPQQFGCEQPCGYCHMDALQAGYMPNTSDPENNEALTEMSVLANRHLLVSIDLTGVGHYYVNDILTTGQFTVSVDSEIPRELVDAACDEAHVPHWGGPVGIAAGRYRVNMAPDGGNSRLEMEGTYDEASRRWSWIFNVG